LILWLNLNAPIKRNLSTQSSSNVINHTLSELRDKIDAIDEQILQLINQRASCAVEVAKTKIAQGEQGTFYRPDRESLV